MSMVNVEDFRRAARRHLPRAVYDHVDCGAGDEETVRANEEAFRAARFRPRQLVDVSRRSQRTTVLGREIEMPILMGPTGSVRLLHRDGELAVARAAARMGTIYTLGTAGSCTIEEVADAAKGAALWFQVYMWRGHDLVRSLVERAARAGYHAIVYTMDTAAPGRRDRDIRNGLTKLLRASTKEADGHARLSAFPQITAAHVANALTHPRWLLRDYLFAPPITFKNVTADDMKHANDRWTGPGEIQKRMNESATWDEVRWLRSIWQGPLVVKGIITADAATKAFDNGADAVIVSNHGGRFLDGLPATFEVLPRIVEAAAGRGKEILIDGGIRRGNDAVKAIALGARACLVARPYCWALAADGERGVTTLLELMKAEVDSCLGNIGRPTLADLDPSALDLDPPSWRAGERRPHLSSAG